MKNVFMPDRIFNSFRDITVQYLKEQKIEALLLDIDNTLVTYEDPVPTEDVMKWLLEMKEGGIKLAFVSNNSDPSRVEKFNENLGFFSVCRAKKPLPSGFRRALASMSVQAENAASVGDQIFTDVWGAKSIGAYAFLVPPIKDKTTLFFRAKRFLERPIIKKYRQLEKEAE